MTQIIFQIRSRKTGLYSKGGSFPSFSKKGKVWTAKGHLSLHFTQLGSAGEKAYRDLDCEVVQYVLSQTEVTAIPVQEFIEAATERSTVRLQEEREIRDKWEREQRLALYERLKKEFK